MTNKRPRADSHSEAISLVFDKLFAIANAPESDGGTFPVNHKILEELKHRLLSAEAEEKEAIRKTAKEFTLDEAVLDFGLMYSSELMDVENYQWKIDTLPDFKTLQPSPCLLSVLKNYTAVYDRSSERGCRVAMNFLLCECIVAMRGPKSTEDDRRTLTPWDTVKVHCEVSFTHTINRHRRTTPKTIVSSRVDHGVGIIIRSNKVPYSRLFHSLLLCIEAKSHGGIPHSAVPQLVVYLACLRQSRINRGQSNASVFGVATDGLSYTFVTITHEGVLKVSRLFNVMDDDLSAVLGCLQYILETAMSMSPNLTPEKEGLNTSDEYGDDPIDLYDIPSLDDDDEE